MKNMELTTKIGKYLTYKEVIKSQLAVKYGLNNIPSKDQLSNIEDIITNIYDPLCDYFKYKVPFNSFFRSNLVNTLAGGSKSSQHLANKGAAIDLDDPEDNILIFNYIKENLKFDQLINEMDYTWIHVSFLFIENRNQVLESSLENNKIVYKIV
jgi:hypothetical protein